MVENDYYSILGVDRNASDKEIKRAFRRLALRYHPDRCPGDPGSEERFKEINEAYAVLGNAGKRREYDHFGPNRFSRRYGEDDLFRAFDFEAIFGELGLRFDEEFVDRVFCRRRWKGCGRGRQKFLRRGLNRGFPFNTMEWDRRIYDLPVSRNEAMHGTEREIVVETNGLRRRYLIRVPAGVMSGARLRISLDEDTIYFEVRLVP